MQPVEPGDAALWVEFYSRKVVDAYQTEMQGREISRMADFIKITVPGNNTFNVDTYVNDRYKQRFPIQWAAYQNGKTEKQQAEGTGTSLDAWTVLTDEQREALRRERFFTIESLCLAADQVLQGMGMKLGMDGLALRERARAFLRVSSDSAALFQTQQETEKLRKEMAERDAKHAAELDAMRAQIEAMTPKRGRPAKEEREAA